MLTYKMAIAIAVRPQIGLCDVTSPYVYQNISKPLFLLHI